MATIIVTPKDLAELNLIQEILKKMKISSKVIEEKSPYSDSFVKKIKKAEKQQGKLTLFFKLISTINT